MPSQKVIDFLLARFSGATQEMLDRIFVPYRLEILSVEVSNKGKEGKFLAHIPKDVWTLFEDGTTGKVVPSEHVEGHAPWREIIKARITRSEATVVSGELYFAPNRIRKALSEVKKGDLYLFS